MKKLMILTLLLLCTTPGWTVPLQQAFDQAQPGAGYDRLVYLNNEVVYTGGLTLSNGNYCILSAGALIDLQGSRIIVNPTALLDVCGVVMIESDSAALKYEGAGHGWVDHVTFARNYDGLYWWQNANMKVTSCIFAFQTHFGVYRHQTCTSWMAYLDAYANTGGHYKEWCPS